MELIAGYTRSGCDASGYLPIDTQGNVVERREGGIGLAELGPAVLQLISERQEIALPETSVVEWL